MTKHLHLGAGLNLPLDAVTETIAILAKRGSGKTYTASVLAEELLKAGQPLGVLDPTGAWWGLRSSADGKGEGFPITILGGDHADVPLDEAAGKDIAEIMVQERVPLVLDLSRLSKSAMRRFVGDFAEHLYQKNREPLHLIIDEADAFAPQKPRPDEMRMLGAIDDIVRRGRIRGLGVTLVTQRSAVLNKDVLTQAEVLIALRTPHPKDRAPVLEWMKVHATPEQMHQVEESLAGLEIGEAWVMSAGWLDIFKKIHIRKRETFNSSATPKPGEKRIEPRKLAQVDLDALQKKFAGAIEQAKATDPKMLQKRVAELQAQVKKLEAAKAPAAKTIYVEVPVLKEAHVKRLEAAVKGLATASDRAKDAAHDLQAVLIQVTWPGKAANAPQALLGKPPHAPPPQIPYSPRADPPDASKMHNLHQPQRQAPAPVNRPAVAPRAQAGDHKATGGLGAGERRMLEALARRHPVAQTRAQVGALSGFASGGGTFRNYCATLKRAGLVAEDRGALSLTDAGIAAAGSAVGAAMSPDAIREMWRRSIGAGEWRMVEALLHAHPASLTRQELGERTEFESAGGTFRNYAATIKRVGLATEDRDGLRVVEELIG